MSKNAKLICPICGNEIIKTGEVPNEVSTYNDFDDGDGFRCSGCERIFTASDLAKMIHSSSA